MKTIFSIQHPELIVTLCENSVYTTHFEDFNRYNKNEISMRELKTFSTNFTNCKEFYCDGVELLEIDNAGIKVNIYKDNKLVDSEFYAIKRYNEENSNIYVNGVPFLLTKGFLY